MHRWFSEYELRLIEKMVANNFSNYQIAKMLDRDEESVKKKIQRMGIQDNRIKIRKQRTKMIRRNSPHEHDLPPLCLTGELWDDAMNRTGARYIIWQGQRCLVMNRRLATIQEVIRAYNLLKESDSSHKSEELVDE